MKSKNKTSKENSIVISKAQYFCQLHPYQQALIHAKMFRDSLSYGTRRDFEDMTGGCNSIMLFNVNTLELAFYDCCLPSFKSLVGQLFADKFYNKNYLFEDYLDRTYIIVKK